MADAMTCVICRHGTLVDGQTTIVLERAGATLIFKDVPARICDNCGEEYVSSEVNQRLLRRAKDALERGTTLDMLRFAA
jgi:YgiT-type zinc finger domain-containing protein